MKRISLQYAVLALALTLAVSAVAQPKYANLTLYHDTMLNGVNLPAGDYKVKYEVEGSNVQVSFLQSGKQLATATGQVKELTKKQSASQVVLNIDGNNRSIAEIDFGGQTTAVSFESAGMATGK